MDARFYNSNDLNIERLATDLEHFFRGQGYQVQQIGNNEQMMVQLKKGSDFEALIGLQAALSVIRRDGCGRPAKMGGQGRGWRGWRCHTSFVAIVSDSRGGGVPAGWTCQPGDDCTGWIGTTAAAQCTDGTCSNAATSDTIMTITK
ncbi:MAG: hypothetical protein E6J04_19045 [Chloroflexi bacterium]|nr:MAG: hypothetical protein E6J04_19045 [Chloroflexota bacterium]